MILRLLRSFFIDPTKDLTKIKPFLKQLHTDVYAVGHIEDPLSALIKLYDATSKFEDMDLTSELIKTFKSANTGQLTAYIETLETLQISVKALGRDMKGKNRTVNGQTVTADDIYLPSTVNGSVSIQLSYWMHESTRSIPIDSQARSLILLHGRDILQSIEFLLKVC